MGCRLWEPTKIQGPNKKGEEGKIGPALAPRFLPEHPIPLPLLIVRQFRPHTHSDGVGHLEEYQRYPTRRVNFM